MKKGGDIVATIIFISTAIAVYCLICGVFMYRGRSRINDFIEESVGRKSLGGWLLDKFSLDRNRIEAWLRVAEEKSDPDTLIGTAIIFAALAICGSLILFILGSAPAGSVFVMPTLICGYIFLRLWYKFKQNRVILQHELFSWLGQVEQNAASGKNNPEIDAAEKQAEKATLLGREMKVVLQRYKNGVPFYDAFFAHFVDILGINDAVDAAFIFEDSAVNGVPMTEHLSDLIMLYDHKREGELKDKLTRLSLRVTGIVTVTVGFAAVLMIAGPVILSITKFIKG